MPKNEPFFQKNFLKYETCKCKCHNQNKNSEKWGVNFFFRFFHEFIILFIFFLSLSLKMANQFCFDNIGKMKFQHQNIL